MTLHSIVRIGKIVQILALCSSALSFAVGILMLSQDEYGFALFNFALFVLNGYNFFSIGRTVEKCQKEMSK